MFQTINPTTGEPIDSYEPHGPEDLEHRLARSWSAYESWRGTGYDERGELLRAVADQLDKGTAELAELMVGEMGKPIAAAESEVAKCALGCRHYADHTEAYLQHDVVDIGDAGDKAYVRFDPMGPIFAIMPWNFPLWQVFRAAAPTLMAGNTMLLKHARISTGTALEIEGLFADAGAPEGLFTTLLLDHDAAAGIIADERVRGVTLTGSVPAGRTVAAQAGQHLKPCVLELGGSDAFVVLEDADLDQAAKIAVESRLLNNGQSCICAKRFIVVDAVADEFSQRLTAGVEAAVVGDPMDRETTVGPLARGDLRDDLHDQVRRSLDEGAVLRTGGSAVDRPGYFYAPTVLDDVAATMAAGAEETFGPVAAVIRAPHEDGAVKLANASEFGLGASVWTTDVDRGERIAARIEAGDVFINGLVRSDPRVPFGGVKSSGNGRELGEYGIKEFTNIKTVWVDHPATQEPAASASE